MIFKKILFLGRMILALPRCMMEIIKFFYLVLVYIIFFKIFFKKKGEKNAFKKNKFFWNHVWKNDCYFFNNRSRDREIFLFVRKKRWIKKMKKKTLIMIHIIGVYYCLNI